MRPVTTAMPTMPAAAMPIMPAVLIPDEGLPLEEADALSAVVVGNALVGATVVLNIVFVFPSVLSGSVDDVLGFGVDEVEGNADVESEVVLELVVTEVVEVVEAIGVVEVLLSVGAPTTVVTVVRRTVLVGTTMTGTVGVIIGSEELTTVPSGLSMFGGIGTLIPCRRKRFASCATKAER